MARLKISNDQKKIRFSITIDPNIIKSIDQKVVEYKTNRSKFIESLLMEYLNKK